MGDKGDKQRRSGPEVEVHLKRASVKDIERQAAELRDAYEVYRTVRKTVRRPGDLTMRYDIRMGREAVSREDLSAAELEAEAARYRILEGIQQHVQGLGDVAAFDLAFDLSCRRRPEDILIPELEIPGGPQV